MSRVYEASSWGTPGVAVVGIEAAIIEIVTYAAAFTAFVVVELGWSLL